MVQQVSPAVVGDSTSRAGWGCGAMLRLTVKPQGTGTDSLLSTGRAEIGSRWGRKSLLSATCAFEHMIEEVAPPVVANLAMRARTLLSFRPVESSMTVQLLQAAEGLSAVGKGAHYYLLSLVGICLD